MMSKLSNQPQFQMSALRDVCVAHLRNALACLENTGLQHYILAVKYNDAIYNY